MLPTVLQWCVCKLQYIQYDIYGAAKFMTTIEEKLLGEY
jgi:hypothetical protein